MQIQQQDNKKSGKSTLAPDAIQTLGQYFPLDKCL